MSSSSQNRWDLGGCFFLQLLWLEAVAPLIAPSGLGRGEPSVIVPAGAFGPKAQVVACWYWRGWSWGSNGQIISGGHCSHCGPLCCCSQFSSAQSGLVPHTATHASPPSVCHSLEAGTAVDPQLLETDNVLRVAEILFLVNKLSPQPQGWTQLLRTPPPLLLGRTTGLGTSEQIDKRDAHHFKPGSLSLCPSVTALPANSRGLRRGQ